MLTELYYTCALYLLAFVIGSSGLTITRGLCEKHALLAGSLGRIVGLFLWAYGYWLLRMAGWLGDSQTALWIYTIVYCSALTLPLILGDRSSQWIAENKRSLIKLECIGIGFFLVGLLFRSLHPAIAPSGGEKFMELMMLQSVIHSSSFPPQDLWLAGEPISYYYLGYVLFGGLMKALGLPAALGLNLAVPLILGLAGCSVAAILHTLVKPVIRSRQLAAAYAVVGTVFLLLAGNQCGVQRLAGSELQAPWWWNATRVIEDHAPDGNLQTIISEFPAFSFLHGDLHPHVMGLPLVLAAISLMIAGAATHRYPLYAGVLLAFAIFTNTWDAPVVLCLVAFPLLRKQAWKSPVYLLGVVAIGLLMAQPFLSHFQSQASGIAINVQNFTPLHPSVTLFLPAIVAALYGAWLLRRNVLEPFFPWLAAGLIAIPWLIKFAEARLMGYAFRPSWDSAWQLTTSGGALLYWLGLVASAVLLIGSVKKTASPNRSMIALLAFLGCGLLLAPEHVFLRDLFQSRMNTIFKLYFQAWIVLGLAALASLPYLVPEGSRRRYLKISLLLLPWLTGSLYTPMAMKAIGGAQGPSGLDGAAWLSDYHPEDARMMAWIKEHTEPNARILEAAGGAYNQAGRIAAFTGRPTWLAWPGHQHQWRGQATYQQKVAPRAEKISQLYRQGTASTWAAFIEEQDIDCIILGMTEMVEYQLTQSRIQELDRMFAAQSFGRSRIYRAKAQVR